MVSRHAARSDPQPRKTPGQLRSLRTVQIIIEGAAHILEAHGLEHYTTNSIAARAGVSIGSLYQYFPNKEAITILLIQRESAALATRVREVLRREQWDQALRAMIGIAVQHQLRRPNLARWLDFEEDRLAPALSPFRSRLEVRDAIAEFLGRAPHGVSVDCLCAAEDLIAIIDALTAAGGRRGGQDASMLGTKIEQAVLGYLGSAAHQ